MFSWILNKYIYSALPEILPSVGFKVVWNLRQTLQKILLVLKKKKKKKFYEIGSNLVLFKRRNNIIQIPEKIAYDLYIKICFCNTVIF